MANGLPNGHLTSRPLSLLDGNNKSYLMKHTKRAKSLNLLKLIAIKYGEMGNRLLTPSLAQCSGLIVVLLVAAIFMAMTSALSTRQHLQINYYVCSAHLS